MPEDELEPQPDTTPEPEPTPEPQPEPGEDYRGKLNAQTRFLKKEGYTFDEEKKQWVRPASRPEPSAPGALSPDAEARITRSELFGLGIKDPEEQKLVTDAAKRLGISVYEAANDEFIAARLDKMREAKKTKEATPAPNRGTGGGTANITKLAEKALATGELPTDPATREKVRAEMKRISK